MTQMITKLQTILQTSENENIEGKILALVDRLDFLDIQLLRKFYSTGKDFPCDTQPFCFPLLYREMKVSNHLKIGREALRKRLDVLADIDLLIKIKGSNPINYNPVAGKETFIRAVIAKFFLINGLIKFLK